MCCLKGRCWGWGSVQADFHCYYSVTQVFPRFLQTLAFGIQMNSPHLTLIFQTVKKSKHTSHYSPGTEETHVNGGGGGDKQKRHGEGKEWKEKKKKVVRGLGRGRQRFTMK